LILARIISFHEVYVLPQALTTISKMTGLLKAVFHHIEERLKYINFLGKITLILQLFFFFT